MAAQITLFPAASLPSCLPDCGAIYDANGACVPPANTNPAGLPAYEKCFCGNALLTQWSTDTSADLCKGGCPEHDDVESIGSWYSSFCSSVAGVTLTASSANSATASSTVTGHRAGGGTWLSSHYQWVIFLVIMFVGITAIWIGACAWRRHYVAKRDRQYALGKNLAHINESGRVVLNNESAGSVHAPSAGMFMPSSLSAANVCEQEKPQKDRRKWIVKQRT